MARLTSTSPPPAALLFTLTSRLPWALKASSTSSRPGTPVSVARRMEGLPETLTRYQSLSPGSPAFGPPMAPSIHLSAVIRLAAARESLGSASGSAGGILASSGSTTTTGGASPRVIGVPLLQVHACIKTSTARSKIQRIGFVNSQRYTLASLNF